MGYETLTFSLYAADKKRIKAVVKKRVEEATKAGEKPPSLSEVLRELIAQEAARLGI